LAATGSFARSSIIQPPSTPSLATTPTTIAETPVPQSQRTRKRGVPLTQDDVELEAEKKKPRIQATTNSDAFNTNISMMKDQVVRRQNKVELANQWATLGIKTVSLYARAGSMTTASAIMDCS
jgi:hypothetical protein